MGEAFATVTTCRVRPHGLHRFEDAWRSFTRALEACSPHAGVGGTLVQSSTDPTLFYSIQFWASPRPLDYAQGDPGVRNAMAELRACCTTLSVETCRVRDVQPGALPPPVDTGVVLEEPPGQPS